MRYSSEQIEFLMALAGVMIVGAGIWLPLASRFLRGYGPWVEIPAASVPLVAFIAVVMYYRRRFRE